MTHASRSGSTYQLRTLGLALNLVIVRYLGFSQCVYALVHHFRHGMCFGWWKPAYDWTGV